MAKDGDRRGDDRRQGERRKVGGGQVSPKDGERREADRRKGDRRGDAD